MFDKRWPFVAEFQALGRPHGGEGYGPMGARGGGRFLQYFCGRPSWMTPCPFLSWFFLVVSIFVYLTGNYWLFGIHRVLSRPKFANNVRFSVEQTDPRPSCGGKTTTVDRSPEWNTYNSIVSLTTRVRLQLDWMQLSRVAQRSNRSRVALL